MSTGELSLDRLIASMNPVLDPATYVFSCVNPDTHAHIMPRALGVFHEDEGLTLILPRETAMELGVDHVFPCRRITLNVHSALEAVGFLAAVATELTRHGISTNPVSGFYHDHIFVPVDQADNAMTALTALSNRQA